MLRTFALFSVLALAPLAAAAEPAEGVSIATVAVPKDSPSSSQAVVVGHIARQGFERNPRYSVLDLELLLENGEIPAAERRRRQAEQALERAKAAYEAFELSPALEAFAEAIVGYEQAVAALTRIDPLVEALRLQAAAYALSGDEKNARRSFEKLLALDPGATLSDPRIPESVQPVFAAAAERAQKKPTGTMTVYAAPAAAEVYVDGRFRGSAPLSIDNLPVGRHYVRVLRDGYQAFGSPVDIGARSEETVQATLRPTARLAEFDDLASRLAGGSEQGAAKLAASLKVDQLLWAVVEAAGDDVTVTAKLTDGVSGSVLASGTKTFVYNSPRFRGDLELWLAQTFRKSQGVVANRDDGGAVGDGGSSFLPDKPVETPTNGKVVVGWTLVGITVVPLGVGVGFGIYSLYWWDVYKNEGKLFDNTPLPDQLHPEVANVRNAYLITSGVADVGYVLAVASLATGITLLAVGMNEQAEIEDVLAEGEAPATPLVAWSPLPPSE